MYYAPNFYYIGIILFFSMHNHLMALQVKHQHLNAQIKNCESSCKSSKDVTCYLSLWKDILFVKFTWFFLELFSIKLFWTFWALIIFLISKTMKPFQWKMIVHVGMHVTRFEFLSVTLLPSEDLMCNYKLWASFHA
jgi:hypothetical protein